MDQEAAKKQAEVSWIADELDPDEFEWKEDLGIWYGTPYPESTHTWIIRRMVVRNG